MKRIDIKIVRNFNSDDSNRKYSKGMEEIYSEQKQKYPIHDPSFLKCYHKLSKVQIILIFESGKMIGYLPYLERTNYTFLKIRNIYLPIQTISKSYLALFNIILQRFSEFRAINRFSFNFTDAYKEIETGILNDLGCIKQDFVTHINRDGRITRSTRYYIRKSIGLECYVDDKFSYKNFIEYCEKCIHESRRRKGLSIGGKMDELYDFYVSLIEIDRGKMLFVRGKNNDVLSGHFLVYNNEVCVDLHGGTSDEGLNLYAGYLNQNGALEFCKQRGLIYDLFGTYVNTNDINYINLYKFKSKWGEEVEVPQYVQCSKIVKVARKIMRR